MYLRYYPERAFAGLQPASNGTACTPGDWNNAGLIFDLDQYLDGMLDHYQNEVNRNANASKRQRKAFDFTLLGPA
jgi:hypothetical protein